VPEREGLRDGGGGLADTFRHTRGNRVTRSQRDLPIGQTEREVCAALGLVAPCPLPCAAKLILRQVAARDIDALASLLSDHPPHESLSIGESVLTVNGLRDRFCGCGRNGLAWRVLVAGSDEDNEEGESGG
jgi:hypothetical protein